MIDYERLKSGASGVGRAAKTEMNEDQLTACTFENVRLRKVIDVQKSEIRRLMRLLGMGLLQK